MISSDTLLRAVEAEREALFDFAARLVRIPTVNPPGDAYRAGAEEIAGELRRIGCETDLIEAHGLPEHTSQHPRVNVVGRLADADSRLPGVHLNGHFDVVPAGEGWTVDPFGGELRDGRLWGRGSADMKAGLACGVFAVQALRRCGVALGGPVEISGTVDEESGGYAGVGYLAREGHLDPARIGWAIIPEPFSPRRICVGHRGVYWFRVVTRGRIAHGSMPFLGRSAINDMGLVLRAIDEQLRPMALAARTELPVVPARARTGTININAIWGGQVPDADDAEPGAERVVQSPCVADRCELIVDRRFLPEEGLEEVRRQVMVALERLRAEQPEFRYELHEELAFEPSATPPGSPLVAALDDAIREVTGSEPEHVASPGTFDQKHFDRIAGIPHCVAYGPGELEQAHQPDEWCSLDAMVESTQVMALAMARLLT